MNRPGSGVQAYRRRAADTERMVDAAVAEVAAERKTAWEEAKAAGRAARERMAEKPAVDVDRLVPGHIAMNRRRDVALVVRVNRTTVTVRGAVGEERWPLDSVIAVAESKTTGA